MRKQDRKPREFSASAFDVAAIDRWAALGKNFRKADPVIKNPVRTACRNAIRILGKRLHELVGDDQEAMPKITEPVSGRAHYSHHISIIDKAWDGIGDWLAWQFTESCGAHSAAVCQWMRENWLPR